MVEEDGSKHIDHDTTIQNSDIDRIIEGVDLLSVEVETLNDRVYSKNYLDRIRNALLAGVIVTFIFVSSILGLVLYRIEGGNRDREREAVQARKQVADCTIKPGTLIEDDYVNPGLCYIESQTRTQKYLDESIARIQEGLRLLLLQQQEAAAANRSLAQDLRDLAASQAAALRRANTTTTTTIRPPPTPTPTTIRPDNSVEPPTIEPKPKPEPEPDGLGSLVCSILSILGLCNA